MTSEEKKIMYRKEKTDKDRKSSNRAVRNSFTDARDIQIYRDTQTETYSQ